jgi:hypothetical protein
MKTSCAAAVALGLVLLAGCASQGRHGYSKVLPGMSRNLLRADFGEPVRITPAAAGGEDWYYRFSSLRVRPAAAAADTTDDFGQRSSSISTSWDFSKQVEELPVHISADGFVVEPVPKGRVVRN